MPDSRDSRSSGSKHSRDASHDRSELGNDPDMQTGRDSESGMGASGRSEAPRIRSRNRNREHGSRGTSQYRDASNEGPISGVTGEE